jgi:oxygen-independent coproporphyrinogen-3 oxidase
MSTKLPGIYVHLPFCSVHCIYCDFPLTTRLSLSDRYYQALLNELEDHPPDLQCDSLYFGGGTPSLAPIDVLKRLTHSVPLTDDAEITLEANPDHVTGSVLSEWKELGINRLSLGIQSLQENVLKTMLRQHSKEQALDNLLLARSSGFENINVDLILGFPGQTSKQFSSDLEQLISLKPDHFSIYLLELHERTGLHRLVESGKAEIMPEEEQVSSFQDAIQMLRSAGYDRYEVSNFAIPGKHSRHNLKYWTDAPYYAYGAGACAYHNHQRTRNHSDVLRYIEAMEEHQAIHEEAISESEDTRARNALIFGLRKTEGINIPEFIAEYRRDPRQLFGAGIDEFTGLLEVRNDQLRLTEQGLLLSNEILSSAL